MKQILIVLPMKCLTGAEQVLFMIANKYHKEKVSLHIHFLYKGDENNSWDQLQGANIHKTYYSQKNVRNGTLNFFGKNIFGTKQKYDIVITSHVAITGLIGLMINLGRIRTEKFIARESTSIFLRYTGFNLLKFKIFYFLGYNQVDLHVCQTDLMKEQFIKAKPRYKNKTITLENPIDREMIQKTSEEPFHVQLPPDFLVSAGRMIPEKGYDILIRVFKKLKKKFPGLKLIILGSGPLQNELNDLVDTLKLEEDVIFPGFVSNVYPYFKKAKVCVVSSRIEGFPNVLLQMMSQNGKVVSTLCAGGIENIEGVKTAQTGNEDSLQKAIEEALLDQQDYRAVFDAFLDKRDISNFVKVLENN